MVATTPKPRVVKLEILPEGEKAIASGNTKHETVLLRREGKNRRCSWTGGTALGETASGHARVGSHGQRPRLRQIGRSTLCRRSRFGGLNWQLRLDSNSFRMRPPQNVKFPEEVFATGRHAVENESFYLFRTSNNYQLSLIHPQLKVGSANQRHPLSPAAILLSRNSNNRNR